jgi:hypothetical protein
MNETRLDDALVALNNAPGPSPWFAARPPERDNEALRWCQARAAGSILSGANLLLDASGAVLLLLPRYSCAQLIKPSRLLCWQSSRDGILFRLFNTDALTLPFATSISAAHDQVCDRATMGWASGLVWEDKLPRRRGGERYQHAFPLDLEDVPEVLALAYDGETQLYRLCPMERQVAVYPQRWFNEGPYDFGYQWPMVVTREDKSQAVVGWGMRLGAFVLDASFCELKTWLYEDHFAFLPPYR